MPTGLRDLACNEPFQASGAHSDPSSSKLQPAGGSGDDASGRGLGGMSFWATAHRQALSCLSCYPDTQRNSSCELRF